MDLNAIVTEPSGRAQPTELVFVHGAWHGAWCWIEHFTEFFADLPRPARDVDPVLVLGAEHDAIFSSSEVRATARAYGTEAVIFDGMGHDMMLESGWAGPAEVIAGWLAEQSTPA